MELRVGEGYKGWSRGLVRYLRDGVEGWGGVKGME